MIAHLANSWLSWIPSGDRLSDDSLPRFATQTLACSCGIAGLLTLNLPVSLMFRLCRPIFAVKPEFFYC